MPRAPFPPGRRGRSSTRRSSRVCTIPIRLLTISHGW
tara:strand:+ start:102639 stop:102749 length:111 start_codon:yes stop_codon:yes gene_type:complete